MKPYHAIHYHVTDDSILPSGKIELYLADTREQAIASALYTHRLHDGKAWASDLGVICCPTCGQIAIVEAKPNSI